MNAVRAMGTVIVETPTIQPEQFRCAVLGILIVNIAGFGRELRGNPNAMHVMGQVGFEDHTQLKNAYRANVFISHSAAKVLCFLHNSLSTSVSFAGMLVA
jgi:hypothetical protein